MKALNSFTIIAAAILTFAVQPSQGQTFGTAPPTLEPTNNPGFPQIARPDLIPIDFTSTYTGSGSKYRDYDVTARVGNIGTKKSPFFHCMFGMKVLASTDSVKYPVGLRTYIGFAQFDELENYDYGESVYSTFQIPLAVTKCEVYIVVDRAFEGFQDIGNWEDDTGDIYIGRIKESDETNNVGGKKTYNFQFILTNP